jgi:hypothetical protein
MKGKELNKINGQSSHRLINIRHLVAGLVPPTALTLTLTLTRSAASSFLKKSLGGLMTHFSMQLRQKREKIRWEKFLEAA